MNGTNLGARDLGRSRASGSRDRASLTAVTWLPPEAPRSPVRSGVENDAMDSQVTVCQLRLDECQVALSEILAAAPRRARLLVPFEGSWNGRAVVVTGVLERTAVVHPADSPDDRVLARQADVLVHPGRLRWKEAKPTRQGEGLVLQPHQRPKRCSDCRRTSGETEFRAYKAAYCVECSRRRQAVIDRRRRTAA
jgi:hypothetical protein